MSLLPIPTSRVEELSPLDALSSMPVARADPSTGYFQNIDDIRRDEYPILDGQQFKGMSTDGR